MMWVLAQRPVAAPQHLAVLSGPTLPLLIRENLPTPLCRILWIAAHRDVVMYHLALGIDVEELSLTSALKLICHWKLCRAESPRTTWCILSVMRIDQRKIADTYWWGLSLSMCSVKPADHESCTSAHQRLSLWATANRQLYAFAASKSLFEPFYHNVW